MLDDNGKLIFGIAVGLGGLALIAGIYVLMGRRCRVGNDHRVAQAPPEQSIPAMTFANVKALDRLGLDPPGSEVYVAVATTPRL